MRCSRSPASQAYGRLHLRVSLIVVHQFALPGLYLIAHSLALELDSPEGLGVATRDVLGHVVRDRVSIAAALRLVQLERASTIVDAVIGVDE